MNLYHVGNHLPTCQTEIDAVGSLALAVADIRCKISRPVPAGLRHAFSDFLHQKVQMAAARVAVPEGAFNHYLRFIQILRLPAGSYTERVKLRGQFSHFLTYQFHDSLLSITPFLSFFYAFFVIHILHLFPTPRSDPAHILPACQKPFSSSVSLQSQQFPEKFL